MARRERIEAIANFVAPDESLDAALAVPLARGVRAERAQLAGGLVDSFRLEGTQGTAEDLPVQTHDVVATVLPSRDGIGVVQQPDFLCPTDGEVLVGGGQLREQFFTEPVTKEVGPVVAAGANDGEARHGLTTDHGGRSGADLGPDRGIGQRSSGRRRGAEDPNTRAEQHHAPVRVAQRSPADGMVTLRSLSHERSNLEDVGIRGECQHARQVGASGGPAPTLCLLTQDFDRSPGEGLVLRTGQAASTQRRDSSGAGLAAGRVSAASRMTGPQRDCRSLVDRASCGVQRTQAQEPSDGLNATYLRVTGVRGVLPNRLRADARPLDPGLAECPGFRFPLTVGATELTG